MSMAKEKIVEKLDVFLQTHNPINEECYVVYLLVEMRKILDRENTSSYPLLRFYCDWSVHVEKDRITKEIKKIVEEIFQDVKDQIENPAMTQAMSPVMRFAYMEDLKSEMAHFLTNYDLSTSMLDEKNWIEFISTLIQVLENQPIKNPADDVALFGFIPAAPGCVQGIVEFKEPINGYGHYKFSNAY